MLCKLHLATKYWFCLGLMNDNTYYLAVLCPHPTQGGGGTNRVRISVEAKYINNILHYYMYGV